MDHFNQFAGSMTRQTAEMSKVLKGLQSLLQSKPAGQPGTGAPGELADKVKTLKHMIGDEATNELLELVKGSKSNEQDTFGKLQEQFESELFFVRYPEMREHQPVMSKMQELVKGDEIPLQWVYALASKGAIAEQLFSKRLNAEKANWEKTERGKFLATLGSGQGITPEAKKAADEAKTEERKKVFGPNVNPKVTHAPPD